MQIWQFFWEGNRQEIDLHQRLNVFIVGIIKWTVSPQNRNQSSLGIVGGAGQGFKISGDLISGSRISFWFRQIFVDHTTNQYIVWLRGLPFSLDFASANLLGWSTKTGTVQMNQICGKKKNRLNLLGVQLPFLRLQKVEKVCFFGQWIKDLWLHSSACDGCFFWLKRKCFWRNVSWLWVSSQRILCHAESRLGIHVQDLQPQIQTEIATFKWHVLRRYPSLSTCQQGKKITQPPTGLSSFKNRISWV